eukprot:1882131-Ditylum_brightwellii.AAC.1
MPYATADIVNICGDDKASVSAGRTASLSASAKQSSCALISSDRGHSPQAADHVWHSDSMTTSVNHGMNGRADSCASLYSGDVDGNGHVAVSINDQISDPSTGTKHVTHDLQYSLHQARETSNS